MITRGLSEAVGGVSGLCMIGVFRLVYRTDFKI